MKHKLLPNLKNRKYMGVFNHAGKLPVLTYKWLIEKAKASVVRITND